ncbi:hypothetical protein BU26DRAFT_511310 [Trematosphaeria pertusa]|uniref:Uncharacterized protein n=1 Tax=Trematosphaeria pertusa TaxID=390896 RepID=A0A6A6HUC0_9PLEO|nr:uncharacterized protein BU26DRAFT_511310 [Trematosphaeria pertusa]KAF2241519.1 hypothetical protein BU26DRAFT_511310 [Trematosphaeria pertusa]
MNTPEKSLDSGYAESDADRALTKTGINPWTPVKSIWDTAPPPTPILVPPRTHILAPAQHHGIATPCASSRTQESPPDLRPSSLTIPPYSVPTERGCPENAFSSSAEQAPTASHPIPPPQYRIGNAVVTDWTDQYPKVDLLLPPPTQVAFPFANPTLEYPFY